jgi:hypothetical protein
MISETLGGYVNLELILPVAFVLAILAACFAGLFWRLASRLDAQHLTAEWLESFSLESYAPMQRLLDRSDMEFLASQAGYRSEIAKRLMRERRKIFSAYLEHLVQDFNQLIGIGKLMVVYSSRDQQEFARHLLRQQTRFYAAVWSVRLQLALYPLGWSVADAHPLVAALAALRDQVQGLASPSQADLQTA